MEDYFKDFEFFGFDSEFHMALELVNEYSDVTKYSEAFRRKSMVELIEHWIDNHAEQFGLERVDEEIEEPKTTKHGGLISIGNKIFRKPGIFSKQS